MSERDRRWRALVSASRKTPGPDLPPPSPAFVERVARRGLAARAADLHREGAFPPQTWAWAAALATASAAALLVLSASAPVRREAVTLAQELARLPTHVPPAPELRAPFNLPAAREALALLPDGPELRSALGLPPLSEDTP